MHIQTHFIVLLLLFDQSNANLYSPKKVCRVFVVVITVLIVIILSSLSITSSRHCHFLMMWVRQRLRLSSHRKWIIENMVMHHFSFFIFYTFQRGIFHFHSFKELNRRKTRYVSNRLEYFYIFLFIFAWPNFSFILIVFISIFFLDVNFSVFSKR